MYAGFVESDGKLAFALDLGDPALAPPARRLDDQRKAASACECPCMVQRLASRERRGREAGRRVNRAHDVLVLAPSDGLRIRVEGQLLAGGHLRSGPER